MTSDDGAGHQWILPNSEIYHSERFGNGESFKYIIPVQKDGLYTLILKFSEIYFNAPEEKIFDVKIGNTKIVEDLDIFGQVFSRSLPYDTFTEIEIKKGKVYH